MPKLIAMFSNFNTAEPDKEYFWLADRTLPSFDNGLTDRHDFESNYGSFKRPGGYFTFINIKDIPANVPYCVYIRLDVVGDRFANEWERILSGLYDGYSDFQRVLSDSERGLVSWFFDYKTESIIGTDYYWISSENRMHLSHHQTESIIKKLRLENFKQNYNLITGAEKDSFLTDLEQQIGIKIHCANPFEKWLAYHYSSATDRGDYYQLELQKFQKDIVTSIESLDTRVKKILMYNRQPRPSRALLLDYLKKETLLDDSLYSWGVDNFSIEHRKNQYVKNWVMDQTKRSLGDWGVSELSKIYDTWYSPDTLPVYFKDELESVDLKINQAMTINYRHSRLCDFKVVTETMYNSLTFLTEKTYKAFLMMMPFVIFANPNTVATLRSKGYKTYDKWINHSYDEIQDPQERFRTLCTEIQRLTSIDSLTWAQMRLEMLPDMIYNANLLELRASVTYTHVFYRR